MLSAVQKQSVLLLSGISRTLTERNSNATQMKIRIFLWTGREDWYSAIQMMLIAMESMEMADFQQGSYNICISKYWKLYVTVSMFMYERVL